MNLTDTDGNVICEISRINLQPNDIIVLDYKEAQPLQETLAETSKYMNQMFPNNKILFMCGGVEIKVFNDGGSANEQRD